MDVRTIQARYDNGKAYFKQMGFYKLFPECERMRAGIQWPPKTERTKNLPRPVLNVIKDIETHKISNILQEPMKMIFQPEEAEDEQATAASDLFSKYSQTAWENMKQDKLNENGLTTCANIGTMIYHYYWDNTIEGGKTVQYIGDVAGEEIDPINCMAGNPQSKDTQKQPYWLITSRDLLDHIKEEAKTNGIADKDIQNILGDKNTYDEAYDTSRYEVTGVDKATVITQYWKEKGTVHMMKVCGSVVIKEDTDTQHTLYPLAVMAWHERTKSIYGKGDTDEIIPNQKAINLMIAMQMMSVQLSGMPRLMVNRSVIQGNVTNDPQNIISFNSGTAGEAAQYLQPPNISAITETLTNFLMVQTKSLNGASDYTTGELMRGGGVVNATAIMLLQKAAAVPIEQIKDRFQRMIEDIGRIWLEFWTINYNTTRMATLKDEATGQMQNQEFKGTDFKGINLRIKIDVGASTQYSESIMMTSLDNFLKEGYISFPQYLQLAPQAVIPFKDTLTKMLEAQQEQEMQIQSMSLNPQEIQAFLQAPPQVQASLLAQMQLKPQGDPQQPGQPQQGQQPQGAMKNPVPNQNAMPNPAKVEGQAVL